MVPAINKCLSGVGQLAVGIFDDILVGTGLDEED
jgi:hypothetical protein